MSLDEDPTLRDKHRGTLIEALRRLGEQDFDGACELLAEDVLCDWPYPPTPAVPASIRGRSAMRDFFAGGMIAFDPYRYEITEIFELVDPHCLIAEYRSNSRYKPSGAAYRNQYLGIFKFEGGLISTWREYLNPLVIADVLESEDPT